MRAGQHRKRVRLQEPIEQIINGQAKTLWQDVGYFWARIEDVSSNEVTETKNRQGISQHLITMRFQELTSNHRVIYGQRVYNFAGTPQADERKTMISVSVTSKEGVLPTANFAISGSGGLDVGGSYA